jgi:hypothetical protein
MSASDEKRDYRIDLVSAGPDDWPLMHGLEKLTQRQATKVIQAIMRALPDD